MCFAMGGDVWFAQQVRALASGNVKQKHLGGALGIGCCCFGMV